MICDSHVLDAHHGQAVHSFHEAELRKAETMWLVLYDTSAILIVLHHPLSKENDTLPGDSLYDLYQYFVYQLSDLISARLFSRLKVNLLMFNSILRCVWCTSL